jgi:hypothetical protein
VTEQADRDARDLDARLAVAVGPARSVTEPSVSGDQSLRLWTSTDGQDVVGKERCRHSPSCDRIKMPLTDVWHPTGRPRRPPAVAMQILRHSGINVTMEIYTQATSEPPVRRSGSSGKRSAAQQTRPSTAPT